MGIPLYYKNIIQDFPDIITPNEEFNIPINNLFMDLNCAIHPCCANKTNVLEMYDSIFDKILECIKLTNVQDLLYIAIDGPAPRTKMEQQRQRRLKSSHENKIWDTNQITPGTPFMNQLTIFLTEKCNDLSINYILSDSNEAGEGEHKIMKYMDSLPVNTNNVVYGLDADLIMLSMIRKHKIYLLRERTEFNIEKLETSYIFCNIQLLKKYVIANIRKPYFKVSAESILHDYLFICFMIGNDFIINSPSINTRYDGLTILLDTYKELQKDYFGRFYLLDNKKINLQYFKLFIKKLSETEDYTIQKILKIRKNQQNKYQRNFTEFPSDITIIQLHNNSYRNINVSDDRLKEFKNHSPVILRGPEEEVFLQNKYYLYNFFNTLHNNPSYKPLIKDKLRHLCEQYVRSIQWTVDYYFNSCNNWRWYYPYHFAPLLKDLSIYLETIQEDSLDHFIEKNEIPHTPEEQLKIVLPHQTDSYYYPNYTPIYSLMKRYLWECHPVMIHS
jgi:5'-3' exonuclease